MIDNPESKSASNGLSDTTSTFSAKRIWVMCLTSLVCILIDQITKVIAATRLPAVTLRYLGDTIRLHYAENQGAFLSLGANLPDSLRFLIFTVFSAVVLLVLVIYVVFYEKDLPFPQLFVWSIIFGGGISNLIDRLFRNGLVRDFLNIGIGNFRTGVFNLADVALTGGVVVAILQNLWMYKSEKPSTNQSSAPIVD